MTRLEQVDDLLAEMAKIRFGWPESKHELYAVRSKARELGIIGEFSLSAGYEQLYYLLHSALFLERTYLTPPSVDESKTAVDEPMSTSRLSQVIDLLARLAYLRSRWFSLALDEISTFVDDFLRLKIGDLEVLPGSAFDYMHETLIKERTRLVSAVDDSLQVPCPDHGGDGPPPVPPFADAGHSRSYDFCGAHLVSLGSLPDGAKFELGGIEFMVDESFNKFERNDGWDKVRVLYFDGSTDRLTKLPAGIKVKPLDTTQVEKAVEYAEVELGSLLNGCKFMLGGVDYEVCDLFSGPTVHCRYSILGVNFEADFPSITRVKIKV